MYIYKHGLYTWEAFIKWNKFLHKTLQLTGSVSSNELNFDTRVCHWQDLFILCRNETGDWVWSSDESSDEEGGTSKKSTKSPKQVRGCCHSDKKNCYLRISFCSSSCLQFNCHESFVYTASFGIHYKVNLKSWIFNASTMIRCPYRRSLSLRTRGRSTSCWGCETPRGSSTISASSFNRQRLYSYLILQYYDKSSSTVCII